MNWYNTTNLQMGDAAKAIQVMEAKKEGKEAAAAVEGDHADNEESEKEVDTA